MNIKKQSFAATIAITLGLGFIAAPQAEAQSFWKYFGSKGGHKQSSHRPTSHTPTISSTLKKNVAVLDKYSSDMLLLNQRSTHSRYDHSKGRAFQHSLRSFDIKVDVLVQATRSGNPHSIKSAARDTQNAFSLIKSMTYRSQPNPKVMKLISHTSPLVSNIYKEASNVSAVSVARTPIVNRPHHNRRSFVPVPTNPFTREVRTSSRFVNPTSVNRNTTIPTVTNTSTQNTQTTTTTNTTRNNDRNNDRDNAGTRGGDRENTDTGTRGNNGGDREGGRGSR